MKLNSKDVTTGLVFVAIGLFSGAHTILHLSVGTGLRMGPGYFPLVLSGLLILLGLCVAVRGAGLESRSLAPAPWRGAALVLLAPVVFGASLETLGLAPALLVSAPLAAFASRRATPLGAAALSLGLALLCIVIFHFALRMPLRLFGPWLSA
jgi:hypothetical protein